MTDTSNGNVFNNISNLSARKAHVFSLGGFMLYTVPRIVENTNYNILKVN